MRECKISSDMFRKDDIRTYIALVGFLFWGLIFIIWIGLNIINNSFNYMFIKLTGLLLSWTFFIFVYVSFMESDIIIGDNYISLPKGVGKSNKIEFSDIREIKYDIFKKTGNIGKVIIIDSDERRYTISGYIDRTKVINEVEKRMAKEEWYEKSIMEGYR